MRLLAQGRPDWDAILAAEAASPLPSLPDGGNIATHKGMCSKVSRRRVGVMTCGPQRMMAAVAGAATRGCSPTTCFQVHEETFMY
jgi:hypothetical protein